MIVFLSVILLTSTIATGASFTTDKLLTLRHNEPILPSMAAYADDDEENDDDEDDGKKGGVEKLVKKLEKTIAEIEDLSSVVDEATIIDATTQSLNQLKSDIDDLDISKKLKEDLFNPVDNAIKKLEQAAEMVRKAKEKQANEKIEQSQKALEDTLKTINSTRGQELSPSDKESLTDAVQTIISNSQLREENVLGIVDENTQLDLTDEILQLIDEKIAEVPGIVSELESKGVIVEIELVEESPLVIVIRLLGPANTVIKVASVVCGDVITHALLQFYESLDDPSLRDLEVLDGLALFFLNRGLCNDAPVDAFLNPEILPQVRNLLFEVGEFIIHDGTPDGIIDALNQPAIRDIWYSVADQLDGILGGLANELVDLFVSLVGSIISGIKFNDLNGNGVFDLGETGLEGWTIFLIDTVTASPVGTTTTDATGAYNFTSLAIDQYAIAEEAREGFVQTFPDPDDPYGGVHLVNITESRQSVADINFGNRQVSPPPPTLPLDGIWQYREQERISQFPPDYTFTKESTGDKLLLVTSTVAGASDAYIFKSFKKSDIENHDVKITWSGTSPVVSGVNQWEFIVADGAYDRTSFTDFPINAFRTFKGAGELDKVDIQVVNFGEQTNTLHPNWTASQLDEVTIFVRIVDSGIQRSITGTVRSIEVEGVATWTFTDPIITPEQTGTTNDFGTYTASCSGCVGSPPPSGSQTIEIVSTDPENGYLGMLGSSCATSPTLRVDSEDRIFVGPRFFSPSISAAGCYRAWLTWDVSSIPDSATVLDLEMKFEKLPKSHPLHDGNVHALIYSLDNKPEDVSDDVLRADIRSGTLYVNGDPNFSVNGNHTTNLGSTAKDVLTNLLGSGVDWFGIGLSASNESTSNWNLAEIDNDPVLVVKYSP